MPGWPLFRSSARRADRLDDLAAALEAGLEVEAAFDAAGLRGTVQEGSLADRVRTASGAQLRPVDVAVLEAAETAGDLPGALRDLAADQRAAVQRARDVGSRLAYPVAVVALALAVTLWLALLGFATVPLPFLGAWLAVVILPALGFFALRHRARRDPGLDLARVPLFGELAVDSAWIPYFEAVGRLHGAGVRIDRAHELATATCPLAHQRARLTAVGSSLRSGVGYGEAVAAAGAFDHDTQRAVLQAERIGRLEETFRSLAARRRAVVEIRARRAARFVGAVAYGLAVVLVAAVLVNFYGSLMARVGGGTR